MSRAVLTQHEVHPGKRFDNLHLVAVRFGTDCWRHQHCEFCSVTNGKPEPLFVGVRELESIASHCTLPIMSLCIRSSVLSDTGRGRGYIRGPCSHPYTHQVSSFLTYQMRSPTEPQDTKHKHDGELHDRLRPLVSVRRMSVHSLRARKK